MSESEDITKLLPISEIYKDIIKPAAQQVGGGLESTAKVARLLLAPIEYLVYMDHLHSLNLAGIWQEGNQEAIFDKSTSIQTGVIITNYIRLTPFGEMFCKACVPETLEKREDVN